MSRRCEKCARSFPDDDAYARHVRKVHRGRAPLTTRAKAAYAGLAVAILAGVGLAFAFGPTGGSDGERTPEERFHISLSPRQGSPDANVTLIAFESPNCPSCRIFHNGYGDGQPSTYDRLVAEYVQTGRLRYVEKTFFVGEPWERLGAAAEKCVWHSSPSHFFDLMRTIYRVQDRITESNFESFLRDWAGGAGLDADALVECARKNPHAADVSRDLSDARDAGVRGTPTYFIVGRGGSVQMVVGPQPYAAFEQAIRNAA